MHGPWQSSAYPPSDCYADGTRLPVPWSAFYSTNAQDWYYYNHDTGHTQWSPPLRRAPRSLAPGHYHERLPYERPRDRDRKAAFFDQAYYEAGVVVKQELAKVRHGLREIYRSHSGKDPSACKGLSKWQYDRPSSSQTLQHVKQEPLYAQCGWTAGSTAKNADWIDHMADNRSDDTFYSAQEEIVSQKAGESRKKEVKIKSEPVD